MTNRERVIFDLRAEFLRKHFLAIRKQFPNERTKKVMRKANRLFRDKYPNCTEVVEYMYAQEDWS